MKKLILFFFYSPFLFSSGIKLPSRINQVTVYPNGAQIMRAAECGLQEGLNEIVFTGLSPKIDENSIQVSGLHGVSILSIFHNINYLKASETNPEILGWKKEIKTYEHKIAALQNKILGLEEEERVITANRLVGNEKEALNLTKVKQISQYYRERITAIKNEVFETKTEINDLNHELEKLQSQLNDANQQPELPQGEITIKLDTPIRTTLSLQLSYLVADAGWAPCYDIVSEKINDPINLIYKANVYQNTGQDWKNVRVLLANEVPQTNISKPELDSHYLNFTSKFGYTKKSAVKKSGYAYNPNIKKVTGLVTDESGYPLPGVSVVEKGGQNGTQTDFDGKYVLSITQGRELVFSYIGMHPEEMPIFSSLINVRMKEDYEALEEVVIIGSGYSEELEDIPSSRASGIRIRGASSIKNDTPPLYIVDGMPRPNFDMSDLDENEINHVEILKGANATTLYGNNGANGVIVVTTKKSELQKNRSKTQFAMKRAYSIPSNGDVTSMEINTFKLTAEYEYFSAPVINENVYLTAKFSKWEKHQLLPGEANIYFEGTYTGKTILNPYITKKEMEISLGIDQGISVLREQDRNFKSKTFTGGSKVLDRTYRVNVKNNKNVPVKIKLMDRIPKSQNRDIKVQDIITNDADYDTEKGLLTWRYQLNSQENRQHSFSFTVKYPKGKYISL